MARRATTAGHHGEECAATMRAVAWGAIEALRSVDPRFVAAALGLYIFSLVVWAVRWRLILAALGHRVPLIEVLLAALAGIFVNNVTPASRLGGEACRVAAINLRNRVPMTTGALSAVYERLSEVPAVAALVIVAIPALVSVGVRVGDRLAGGLFAVGLGIAAYLAYRRFLRDRTWWKSWRGRLAAGWVGWRTAALAIGCSTVVWAQDVARLMTVAAAFGVTLSVPQASMLAVLTIVGGLVPTVGGLGAIEGGLVAGLMLFGISAETAAAVTAVERVISYVFSTGAGATAFALIGGRTLWNAVRSRSSATGTRRE